ncbi:site-specific integrase [Acidiphilium iwatense]|uniref:Tyr recombinase domain-containing protein n=1 Tax=Acidiphilium iwatense TaxID=768198 RepID=A0ABS9E0L6_9PROT|nr:hypothetical protein [Acidiphilium iwatense]MCF3948555.1 hypothetical protein [Acidiphilium iwatense]
MTVEKKGTHAQSSRTRRRSGNDARTVAKPGLVLKLAEWPDEHRALWETGTAPKGSRLAKPKHADALRPMSIRNAARGYGAFLAVLNQSGVDMVSRRPAELVTPPNVAVFVEMLTTRGNLPNSIKVRLFDLRVALRIMEPAVELDWLTRPGGVSINDIYPQQFVEKHIPDPREMTKLGMTLIERGRSILQEGGGNGPLTARYEAARRDVRNGLIFGLLAVFPIRIGNLAIMQIGQHVIDQGDQIWLKFAHHEVKNGRSLECVLPEHLHRLFRYYLDVVHPEMADTPDAGWFWLNADGTRFRLRGIEGMFRRQTAREFGTTIGPHSTRRGLPTALADAAPSRPGLAAAILGVSEEVVSRHYRRADQRHAARFAGGLFEQERETMRLRAQRLLGAWENAGGQEERDIAPKHWLEFK